MDFWSAEPFQHDFNTGMIPYIPKDTLSIEFRNITQEMFDQCTFPKTLKQLVIINGDMDTIDLMEGIEYASCANLGLKKIIVPDSITYLYCEDNHLLELELPIDCIKVDASNNRIKCLTIRGDGKFNRLEELYLQKNRLIKVDFIPPPTLCWLETDRYVEVSQDIQKVLKEWQDSL
jgi:hypothetical protein